MNDSAANAARLRARLLLASSTRTVAGKLADWAPGSRQPDCYFADGPSPSRLKRLPQGGRGAAD